MIDPDGQIAGKAIKFLRNTAKHKGNPIKGGAETISGAIDDIGTLVDGKFNSEDVQAAISLITGLDKKDQKAVESTIKQLRKGSKTRRRNADDHRKRADDFEENPTVREGMEGQSDADIKRQHRERADHLRSEANEFDEQADAADAIADRLEIEIEIDD